MSAPQQPHVDRHRCDDLMIRAACPSDAPEIWRIIEPAIREGESFALPRNMTAAEAIGHWMGSDRECFVAQERGSLLGTYYLRANQLGGGAHVANAGYATAPAAAGRGIARRMCEHSIEQARARGFRAMQFNFVVSSNERAVRLWQSLGFEIVGTLPGAFARPTQKDVDAFVMYRKL